MKKRGEKSLQMIFGLMMLLIISLVVLTMFFKFSKKGTETIDDKLMASLKEAAKEEAVTQCQTLCNKVVDDNSLIEYCSAQFSVDWNTDGLIDGAVSEGKWTFCEKRIPCFVLVEDCKNKYDGYRCGEILAEKNKEKYYTLFLNTDGSIPTDGGAAQFEDGCGLSHSLTVEDPANSQFPTCYNWKERFCFDHTYSDVNSGMACPTDVFKSECLNT